MRQQTLNLQFDLIKMGAVAFELDKAPFKGYVSLGFDPASIGLSVSDPAHRACAC